MTFNNLWRKKCCLIIYSTELTPGPFLPAVTHHVFLFFRDMSSDSDVVDQSRHLSRDVHWWKLHGEGTEMWKLHLPPMPLLLCHYRWGMYFRQRVSWGPACNVSKENCVFARSPCVCVCLFSMCEEKLRFLSRWLGSSLHFPPRAQFRFWITNHLLFLS